MTGSFLQIGIENRLSMNILDSVVELETSTGLMRTYLYTPNLPGTYPGLMLFSEIFQQTEPIVRVARMFAGHGYLVAVPEIFHELEAPGTVLAYDQAGADRGNQDKIGKAINSYDDDARVLIEFFEQKEDCNKKIGAIGICIGGHLAFRAAMNRAVLATACFYATDIHKSSLGLGMKDNSLKRVKEIAGELLMIWGRQDPHIPTEGRQLLYAKLHEAGTNFTWHEFNGAHAFMRDEGARYDPELALICYRLALDLFHRRLR